jgi:TerC family integral membrane protein
MGIETIGTLELWIGFGVFLVAVLAVDLGLFHRDAHELSFKEAAAWSTVWVVLALIFNAGIYAWFGAARGLEFLTGYLIEKALAVDNIFVFAVIFSHFAVPKRYQHSVLFWGIVGAVLTRGIFIFAGAALIHKFHWLVYIFGGFLVLTGIKLLLQKEAEIHPEDNPLYKAFKRSVPAAPGYEGGSFFVRRNGRWLATPLFLVLVSIEITDVIFAVDSIPAIFAVTSDPFIVFTSNIFAILGLRAMYFLLAGVMDKFEYLKFGLGAVLIFIGVKMALTGIYAIPIGVSLTAVAALIGGSIAVSPAKAHWQHTRRHPATRRHQEERRRAT